MMNPTSFTTPMVYSPSTQPTEGILSSSTPLGIAAVVGVGILSATAFVAIKRRAALRETTNDIESAKNENTNNDQSGSRQSRTAKKNRRNRLKRKRSVKQATSPRTELRGDIPPTSNSTSNESITANISDSTERPSNGIVCTVPDIGVYFTTNPTTEPSATNTNSGIVCEQNPTDGLDKPDCDSNEQDSNHGHDSEHQVEMPLGEVGLTSTPRNSITVTSPSFSDSTPDTDSGFKVSASLPM